MTADFNTFQDRVEPWLKECFGDIIPKDKVERNHRFLEEALELVQALNCSKEDAHDLVEYVYNRAVGEPHQEVGGVMVTLAALCLANELDMCYDGETELTRIKDPALTEKLRIKQLNKPTIGPRAE